MKFINRIQELQALERLWDENSSQFVIIYGRRRVGKTEIIKQFIAKKPAIYYLADKRAESESLRNLGRVIGEHFSDNILAHHGFRDWYELFGYLKDKVKRQMVFVIDEFPYLAENNKAISSIFQKGWDEYLKVTPIFFILCGSSMAMMEKETLAYKAPLYGRRTGQILVKPLRFFDAHQFFPSLSFEEFMKVFAVVGGNPAYLLQFSADYSWEENVKTRIFNSESFLYREVEYILREELREPRNYLSILRVIASNRTRFSEITNETGMEKTALHRYLFVLEDLDLIVKEVPVTEKDPIKSKRGLYFLKDQFFRFWFSYIYPFKSELEMKNFLPAMRKLRQSFQAMLSQAYESVAQEVLRKHQEDIFPFMRIGRWWYKGEEIDIVALNPDTKEILFAEVKWGNKPVGVNIYEDLRRKASLIDWYHGSRKEYYALFSKTGFTDKIKEIAKRENLYLFDKGERWKG